MFTIITSNISSQFQQTDHGASIDTRPVIVRFSFGSRQVLVRLSFVSRSLFVSLSKTERGLNEEQAKNERKSNEYRSRCRRETIGNSTSSHRHGWQNTLLQPQNSILPFALLLPRHFQPHSGHSHGESRFSYPFCTFPVPITTKASHKLQKAISATNPTTAQNTPPYPI